MNKIVDYFFEEEEKEYFIPLYKKLGIIYIIGFVLVLIVLFC